MSTDTSDPPCHQPASSASVDEGVFRDLVAKRAARLLDTAAYLSHAPAGPGLTRPLLGNLFCQSTQIEELLDQYGTSHNQRWWRFRALTATIKLFASVSYKLQHLHHVLPSYRLQPIDRDFAAATLGALTAGGEVVRQAAVRLLEEAHHLEVPIPARRLRDSDYSEQLPAGHLPHDRDDGCSDSAATVVTHLATEFLNLAAETEPLQSIVAATPDDYRTYYPDPLSAERLRHLQYRFHNLQSLYDTYVSATRAEHLDADMPVLRGHVSVMFHLLEIATELAHYCERHLRLQSSDPAARRQAVVDVHAPLTVLMGYAFTYSSLCLGCGRRLCQEMLKRYAEVGRVEVPVPNFRGFHVRPSTLVAKVVTHYGSDVRLELDGQSYDASSPLELFRANEKINSRKRRSLVREISELPLRQEVGTPEAMRTAVLEVVFALAERGKLVIYEQPLALSDTLPDALDAREGGLLEHVGAEITRLQATGQIDINTGLTVSFVGDKRVLADIELLAKHGYGEDSFGNNIPLPKELSYLRR